MVLTPIRATRSYVAQAVMEQLASAILEGTFAEGSQLPSERVLAEELGVSRVLVRQATHRLAEMGLLRVRQGAPTRVGSLREASGIGLLDLIYRLGERLPPEYEAFVIERQYLNGQSLLELASRNGAPIEHAALVAWVNENAERAGQDFLEFERGFWLAVASAGHNPIYSAELRWWYDLTGARMARPQSVVDTPLETRIAFLRELARRLHEDDHVVAYYMAVVGPILASLRS